MLEVDQVTKAYPSPTGPVPVLRSIDLRLAPGGRATVMGPSGSGKSTLLAILGALDEPTSGRVRLDGIDPFAGTPAERAAFRIPDNMIRLACGIEDSADLIADLAQALDS